MRIIYALLILSILLVITLLVASFIYLEKTTHENFYYIIKVGERDKGCVEIDTYITEKNIIYKSRVEEPYKIGLNKKDIRLELDRKTSQIKFYEEINSDGGIKELLYLKRRGDNLDFLAIAKSKFAYFDNMKIKKDVLLFERETPMTLVPLIKLYNFKKGGSQSFNVVKYDIKLLPPSRDSIILTSIRDEYVNVDNKKIKTECLLLTEKGAEQIFIWVAKKNHTIIAVGIPDKQTYIKRTEKRKKFIVKDYLLKDPSYISLKFSFISNISKELELDGILTRPKKAGIYPAVILFQGEEAIDKSNYGIFIDLSDYLAKSGYVVLRFEPFYERNGGSRFKSISIEDELGAIESAVKLLKEFRFVDPERIGIIAHSDANYILPLFLRKETGIRAWVMLSPRRLTPIVDTDSKSIKAILENISQIDINYNKAMSNSERITLDILETSTKDWKNIVGKKVFFKRMRGIIQLNPSRDMKNLSIPILVLQGKMDNSCSIKYLQNLEKWIKENGHENRSLVYFRRLNHYLGDVIEENLLRDHYKIDSEVLETITGWLDKNLTNQ